ncbi:hypothetical protein HYY73_00855 [Candidatus Woesearchaeota archaeon]|nr:hypothetical protein [Candidatus Woesearchaeota archaeon]
MQQENQFKREVARKASVADILRGAFAENEEGSRTLLISGKHARRVNILATIVDKSGQENQAYKSAVIDDGTARIRLRFFDNEPWLFEKAGVGDFALIVGKPRSYGSESYIAPEIIKPLKDVKWAEVRKLELKALQTPMREGTEEGNAVAAAGKPQGNGSMKNVNESDADFVSRGKQEIYRIIKGLDAGRGADMIEVVAKAAGGNSEQLIKEMILAGDIFEILPGKLKVLE